MYRSCGVMTLSRMPGGSPANCARYASGLDAVFIKSAIMYSRLHARFVEKDRQHNARPVLSGGAVEDDEIVGASSFFTVWEGAACTLPEYRTRRSTPAPSGSIRQKSVSLSRPWLRRANALSSMQFRGEVQKYGKIVIQAQAPVHGVCPLGKNELFGAVSRRFAAAWKRSQTGGKNLFCRARSGRSTSARNRSRSTFPPGSANRAAVLLLGAEKKVTHMNTVQHTVRRELCERRFARSALPPSMARH